MTTEPNESTSIFTIITIAESKAVKAKIKMKLSHKRTQSEGSFKVPSSELLFLRRSHTEHRLNWNWNYFNCTILYLAFGVTQNNGEEERRKPHWLNLDSVHRGKSIDGCLNFFTILLCVSIEATSCFFLSCSSLASQCMTDWPEPDIFCAIKNYPNSIIIKKNVFCMYTVAITHGMRTAHTVKFRYSLWLVTYATNVQNKSLQCNRMGNENFNGIINNRK